MDQEQYMKALQSLEIQQKYIENYQGQLGAMDSEIKQLNTAKETIQAYQGLSSGDDILVPVGSGFFVFGKIAQPGKVISGVGGGISVQESSGKAHKRLEERLEGLEKMRTRVREQLTSLEQQYRGLARQVEAQYAKMNQGGPGSAGPESQAPGE